MSVAAAKRLVRNAAKCLDCHSVVESKSRHHFAQCPCPNGLFVDGGLDYIRSGAKDFSRVRRMDQWETQPPTNTNIDNNTDIDGQADRVEPTPKPNNKQ